MQNQISLQNYEEQQQHVVIPNSRGPQDAGFISSVALPAAAAAAVYTPSLNLVLAMAMSEHYFVQVDVPTIGTQLGSAYTLTVELQGSADNITFTRVIEAADIVITGDAGTPSSPVFRLSPDAPQYVRAAFTTGATIVGSLAAYTGFLSLRF
jgi:hypothetical protein